MPYIKRLARISLQEGFDPETPGELNYTLTRTCHRYLENRGQKYDTYAEIVSALECAKLELYRRLIAPYEDTKIEANGDVMPENL